MNTYLGIELGSTRIKAVAINDALQPIASGDYMWKSDYQNGVWTYNLDNVWDGIRTALNGVNTVKDVASVGVSGMMHGYLAFDKDWNLLCPFRTWQNTITAPAAAKLTELFGFNVPQRWSIAHLYQALLNGEDHIDRVAHITTLAGYVHYMLTGVNAIGIGEASGMFPVDSNTCRYDVEMMEKFNRLAASHGMSWNVSELLPDVLVAGECAGKLTEAGAQLLGGALPVGVPFAPPEGDGPTGMVATNAVAPRTGNVSAGTSIFAMVVLERPLKTVHEEIDVITTPSGKSVAMVHCNNGTNDSNAWVSLLGETAELFGASPSTGELYTNLYRKSLEGDPDCGGVLVCNYMAGEVITHLDEGRPMVVRTPDSKFTLANFFRATLYATMATLKFGMDILAGEDAAIDSMTAHGGLFKTPDVGARYMAACCNAPVTVMETAGEGGAYGMALLAAFAQVGGESLEDFLNTRVFVDVRQTTQTPIAEDVDGFARYVERYRALMAVEKTAVDVL